MVARRPSPVDTPDATEKNRVIHYVVLALIVIAIVTTVVLVV